MWFKASTGHNPLRIVIPRQENLTSFSQAQYLQEVLLRISSLLDNLHILAQMHSQIDSGTAWQDQTLCLTS